MFSAPCFSLSGSRCMSDAITSTKLKQTRKCFGTAEAVWVHGYLRFEPGARMWNEGFPCLSADCKIFISSVLFQFSHSIWDWTALSLIFFWGVRGGGWGGFFKTFLEGPVDHMTHKVYIMNRSSFIYCGMATRPNHANFCLLLHWICRDSAVQITTVILKAVKCS